MEHTEVSDADLASYDYSGKLLCCLSVSLNCISETLSYDYDNLITTFPSR